jgi:UPF0716 family protein affecting phage T7 exclusion
LLQRASKVITICLIFLGKILLLIMGIFGQIIPIYLFLPIIDTLINTV